MKLITGILVTLALLLALAATTIFISYSPVHAFQGAQPPAKPTGLQISTQSGSLSVSVDWDDVAGADSYWVRWRSIDNGEKLNGGVRPSASGTTITVADYGEWVVRVQACNDAGCGKPLAKKFTFEAASEPTPEPTQEPTPEPTTEPVKSVPERTTGLQVSAQSGSLSVSVDWDDAAGADSYWVRWRSIESGEKLNGGVRPSASGTTITVADYGEWVVRVQACNDAGCGKPQAKNFTVEAAPEPTPEPTPTPERSRSPQQSVPGQPTGLVVSTEAGSLDVSVNWDDVADADSYLVRWREAGQGNQLNAGVRPSTSETTITVSDLGNWVVQVEACNTVGCGPGATASFTVEAEEHTSILIPPQPTGLQIVTVSGSLDVSVDWDETTITRYYLVSWRETNGGSQPNGAARVQFSDANITVAGYGEWVLRVEACNDLGCGPGTEKRFNVEQALVPTPSPNPTGVISVEMSSDAGGKFDFLDHWFCNPLGGYYRAWKPDYYAIGDEIEVTVGFDAEMTVGGSPTIAIALGNNSRSAQYVRVSGKEVIFTYQVQEGDEDTDGIHIPANSITLNEGDFIRYSASSNDAAVTHSAIPVQTKHKVDGIRPRVTSAEVLNSTQLHWSDGLYIEDEMVLVEISFSESVVHHSDFPPTVQLDFDGQKRAASNRCWTNGFYAYEVQEGDFDSDGLTLSANSLAFPAGGYIKDMVGNDAKITHSGDTPGDRYKVDARAPILLSAHTSTDGEEVVVVFDETIRIHRHVRWLSSETGKSKSQYLLDAIEIRVDNEVASETSARYSGSEVTVVLEQVIQPGQTVTVAYTTDIFEDDARTEGIIADRYENITQSFSAQTVRNDAVSQSEN